MLSQGYQEPKAHKASTEASSPWSLLSPSSLNHLHRLHHLQHLFHCHCLPYIYHLYAISTISIISTAFFVLVPAALRNPCAATLQSVWLNDQRNNHLLICYDWFGGFPLHCFMSFLTDGPHDDDVVVFLSHKHCGVFFFFFFFFVAELRQQGTRAASLVSQHTTLTQRACLHTHYTHTCTQAKGDHAGTLIYMWNFSLCPVSSLAVGDPVLYWFDGF